MSRRMTPPACRPNRRGRPNRSLREQRREPAIHPGLGLLPTRLVAACFFLAKRGHQTRLALSRTPFVLRKRTHSEPKQSHDGPPA